MENLILLAHLIIALVIVGLILLQQGKGAEVGASFGSGASQTLFGASGSGNFFAKLTALFATAFFVTSFSLAIIAKNKSVVGDGSPIPALDESDLPVLEDLTLPAGDDLPLIEDVPSIDSGETSPE